MYIDRFLGLPFKGCGGSLNLAIIAFASSLLPPVRTEPNVFHYDSTFALKGSAASSVVSKYRSVLSRCNTLT